MSHTAFMFRLVGGCVGILGIVVSLTLGLLTQILMGICISVSMGDILIGISEIINLLEKRLTVEQELKVLLLGDHTSINKAGIEQTSKP